MLLTYLRKSQSSAAASISACHAVFPWPNIVAAISSYRYFPLTRSAALRNTAALSAKGNVSHAGFAARAESIAFETSEELACEYLATCSTCDEGFGCAWIDSVSIYSWISKSSGRSPILLTSLPPITAGTLRGTDFLRASRAASSCCRSGESLA